MLLDRALEGIVVRDHQPLRVPRRLEEGRRDRLLRKPDFRGTIIDGIADAEHLGAEFLYKPVAAATVRECVARLLARRAITASTLPSEAASFR